MFCAILLSKRISKKHVDVPVEATAGLTAIRQVLCERSKVPPVLRHGKGVGLRDVITSTHFVNLSQLKHKQCLILTATVLI